jgi:hypothetical protein
MLFQILEFRKIFKDLTTFIFLFPVHNMLDSYCVETVEVTQAVLTSRRRKTVKYNFNADEILSAT